MSKDTRVTPSTSCTAWASPAGSPLTNSRTVAGCALGYDVEASYTDLRWGDSCSVLRGADWVAFSPPELDQYAIDRAIAWLASAWRRADGDS